MYVSTERSSLLHKIVNYTHLFRVLNQAEKIFFEDKKSNFKKLFVRSQVKY
jgi:hypothetical protein